jgi:hypothetical protein
MTTPEPLGYVLANVGAKRAAYLSHTSVMTRAEAETEKQVWARKGETYTVCALWPALDPFTPLPETGPSPEGEPE